MDLKGKKVTHISLGEGKVVAQGDDHIAVRFKDRESAFAFPEAFDGFLSIGDKALNAALGKLIATKQGLIQQAEEEEQQRLEEVVRRLAQPYQGQHTSSRTGVRQRNNVAFKCTYCDGGKSKNSLGFQGVCSDANIRQNIERDKRSWCSQPDCACGDYLRGEISRDQLDQMMEDGGGVCYESAMFRDWRAYAGVVHTGPRAGQPMRLMQVSPGSLCALTTRLPGSREGERLVFGLFLVDDSYQGDGMEAGYVAAHERFRLQLSPQEAEQLPFWRYHSNDSRPEKAVWSSGLHRYFGTTQAALMLRDVAALRKGKPGGALAQEMYEHYCQLHSVKPESLGQPSGALTLT